MFKEGIPLSNALVNRAVRRLCAALLFAIFGSPLFAQDLTKVAPEDLDALTENAREFATRADGEFDPAIYYGTLAAGLQSLLQKNVKGRRGPNYSESFVPDNMTPPHVLPGAYADPERQEVLDALMERLRGGGIGLRIVGGEPANERELTETVAIIEDETNELCTGTLIGEDAVLTAAHCVCAMGLRAEDDGTGRVLFGNPAINTAVGSVTQSIIDKSRTVLQSESFCDDMETGTTCGRDLAVVFFDGDDCTDCALRVSLANAVEGAAALSDTSALIAGDGSTTPGPRGFLSVRRTGDGSRPPKMYAAIFPPFLCDANFSNDQCQPGVSDNGCERMGDHPFKVSRAESVAQHL